LPQATRRRRAGIVTVVPETSQPRSAARTASVVAGAIAAFVAAGLLIAGGVVLWVNGKKDHAGYVSTKSERFSSGAYAIATNNLDADIDAPHWIVSPDHYGKIRLRVTPRAGKPVFVGIAPTRAVERYLDATAHDQLTDVSYPHFRASYDYYSGGRRPAPPAAQRFWVASAHGAGRQTVTWNVRRGSWSIVLMNADGSRGVDAGVSAGARLPFLAALGWGSLGGGVLMVAIAAGLMVAGLRRRAAAPAGAGALEPQPVSA
jgi:hypothetical protein